MGEEIDADTKACSEHPYHAEPPHDISNKRPGMVSPVGGGGFQYREGGNFEPCNWSSSEHCYLIQLVLRLGHGGAMENGSLDYGGDCSGDEENDGEDVHDSTDNVETVKGVGLVVVKNAEYTRVHGKSKPMRLKVFDRIPAF